MEKIFTGVLILNWKTGQMKVMKRRPIASKINAFHIPVEVSIKVKIPDAPTHQIKGDITVPETKVSEMVLESI